MTLNLRSTFLLCLSSLLLLCSCEKDDPSPDAPKACFTASGELESSMPVNFTSDCSVNAVSYVWDFGDSKTSTEPNPVHTYTSGGKFSVKLTVKNANGAEHSVTQSLDISEVETVIHFSDVNANETGKQV